MTDAEKLRDYARHCPAYEDGGPGIEEALHAGADALERSSKSCIWTEDCSDWQSGCDVSLAFSFNNAEGPESNGFRHCPYCGRPLVEIPADEEDKR